MYAQLRLRLFCWNAPVLIGSMLLGLATLDPLLAQAPHLGDPPAQAAYRLTLDECIAIALKNQPAIAAQRSAMCAAIERRRIARSYYLPQLSFEARYTHIDQSRSVDFPSPFAGTVGDVFSDAAAYFGIARQAGSAAANAALDDPNNPPFSITKQAALSALPDTFRVGLLGENSLTTEFLLAQPLWTGGKISYRHQQAQLGIQAASADVAKSEQQTVFGVTRAYWGVQLARELAGVIEEVAGQLRAIERLINAHLEEVDEYVNVTDLHRVRAIRWLAESEQVGAERAADLAHEALRQAMGLETTAKFEISDSRLVAHKRHLELPAILDEAMIRRPELAKARVAVRLAELERKLARANYLPDICLFGRFGTIDDDGGFLNPNDRQEWAVGVSLGVPIYTGGRRSAQKRQADFKRARASYARQLAHDLVALEVQKAYLEYLEMSKRLPLAENAAQETKKTLDGYTNLEDEIRDEDTPDYYEDVVNAWVLRSLAWARYYDTVFRYNLSLAKIKLVTASDEYKGLFDDPPLGTALVHDGHGTGAGGNSGREAATQGLHLFEPHTWDQR